MENKKNLKALVNTPITNAEMSQNLAKISAMVKAADEANPVPLRFKAGKGMGGLVLSYTEGGQERPVGNFISPKGDKLKEYADKEEISTAINDGTVTPVVIGTEGKYLVVTWVDAAEFVTADKGEAMTVEEAKAAALAKGFPEAEVDERITYARNNKVAENHIAWGVAQLELCEQFDGGLVPRPKSLYVDTPSQDRFGRTEKPKFATLMRYLANGIFVILDGPMGCGKNVLLETKDWWLNRPSINTPMSNDITSEDLKGFFATDNSSVDVGEELATAIEEVIEEGNVFTKFLKKLKGEKQVKKGLNEVVNLASKVFRPSVVFNDGPVVEALVTPRCDLNLDEVNLASAGVLAGVLNTLADRHSPYLYVSGKGKVAIREDFVLTATMNGADCDYAGTLPLNPATKSRFAIIRFVNPTTSVYGILESATPFASAEAIMTVDNIYCHIRSMYQNGTIGGDAVNMRGAKRMLEVMADGSTVYEALLENILNGCDNEEADLIYTSLVDAGLIDNGL